MKAFPLKLVSINGAMVPATARVSTAPVPGSGWRDFTVQIEWPDGTATGTGCDAFDALRAARVRLDAVGLTPRCFGACRNFVMSPMASQAGGMGGHLVRLGCPAEAKIVMTFDAGPDMDLSSVAEQDEFKAAWFESLGHPV